MTAANASCNYCGRQMWRAGLEPCCDKSEHAGRFVCADVRGCVDVVLARLHEASKPDQAAAQLEQIRLVIDQVLGDELADRQYALEEIHNVIRGDL